MALSRVGEVGILRIKNRALQGTGSGGKIMNLETAYRLANALNVPMEDLMAVDEIHRKK